MLVLRTLGEFALFMDRAPVRIARRKHLGLLVYLVAHAGVRLRRDRLAALLWCESPERRARHSLSQALYDLRRRLPSLHFEVTADEVKVPRHQVSADFVHLREEVESKRYSRALFWYGGDFLPGFWVPDAPAFEEWQERMRAELRRLAHIALRQLLREAESEGDHLGVFRIAGRILEDDPFDESVHRSRIRAIAELSGLGAARSEYARLVRVLAREVGRAPSPETVALAMALRPGRIVDRVGR